MDMDYLWEFSVIAKLGSFSLAADELCISQSSLSKHILTLEKELNVKLLDRTTRNVTLSEVGAQILPFADKASEISKTIKDTAADANMRELSVLNIASIPVMALYDITGITANFQKKYPDIVLRLSECENSDLSRKLDTNECELAFVRPSDENSVKYEYISYYKDHLVAVLPRSHRLISKKKICLKDLKEDDFLLLAESTALYILCHRLCREQGFVPKVKYTGHRPENIIDLVSQGMGIALLMKRHTEYFKNDGVVCIDIAPTVENNVCLAKMKNHVLSKSAKIFWDHVASLQNQ